MAERSRWPVVVKTVKRGLDLHDEGLPPDSPERARRGRFYADGWIDGDTQLAPDIPINKRVAFDFPLGTYTPATMLRCWAEGDEKTALEIVENDLGPAEEFDFSYSGPASGANKVFEHKKRAKRRNFLVVSFVAEVDTGESCVATLYRYNADGSGRATMANLSVTSAGVESALILAPLSEGQYLRVGASSAVGGANGELHLTATAVLRERIGS